MRKLSYRSHQNFFHCTFRAQTSEKMNDNVSFNDEGFDESLDDVNFCMVPDPFSCTLQIDVQKGEASYLKQIYAPLLEGLDPTFQFVTINENDQFDFSKAAADDYDGGTRKDFFHHCQAISVVLFLYEEFGRLSATNIQKNFDFSPWEFHHRVELPAHAKPRITAGQDFYETFSDLPLWSICPVHCGNEHLRFHLFVKNFKDMKSFYESLTSKKATSVSAGFCFFTLYSQSGFDMQLSLKYMPEILPQTSNSSRLRLKIKDINAVMDVLSDRPIRKGDTLWVVKDPDGNALLIEETEPSSLSKMKKRLSSNASLDTSDYETASIDTGSLAGSINYSFERILSSSFSEGIPFS